MTSPRIISTIDDLRIYLGDSFALDRDDAQSAAELIAAHHARPRYGDDWAAFLDALAPEDVHGGLANKTISDVLAMIPEGAEWRIVNSFRADVKAASGCRGLLYWDEQGAVNPGWAYQLAGTVERPEESGEINGADDLASVFA